MRLCDFGLARLLDDAGAASGRAAPLPLAAVHAAAGTVTALAADGGWAACGGADGAVSVWRVALHFEGGASDAADDGGGGGGGRRDRAEGSSGAAGDDGAYGGDGAGPGGGAPSLRLLRLTR